MSDTKSIKHLFESFRDKKLLIIGDVMIDAYLWGSSSRMSPEAPVPIVNLKHRENRPGGAANVAMNIKNLGAIPLICSAIGDDPKGAMLLELIREHGISNTGIITLPERTTTVKYRVFGNKTQMLRIDEEDTSMLNTAESKILQTRVNDLLDNHEVHAVVFEDYDKGVITPGLIRKVVERCRKSGIPVVVDPKRRNFLEYKDVSLFKPNLRELRDGMQCLSDLKDTGNLEKAVFALQDKINAEIVLTTLSERGIHFSHNDKYGNRKSGLIPAAVKNIADVSGAGDTVISIAALCLTAKAPAETIAKICNIGGGLVCEQTGVVPVDLKRLIAVVNC